MPQPQPERGSLSDGLQLFTDHCAGCHQVVAEGGYLTGAVAPPLEDATADPGRRGDPDRPVRDAALLAAAARRGTSTRSSATCSGRSTRTTAAAGRSAISARCRKGWSRGSSRRPRWSRSASCSGRGCAVSKAKALLISAVALLLAQRRRPALGRASASGSSSPSAPSRTTPSCVAIGSSSSPRRAALAFVVVYVLDRLPAQTQLLGLALGLASRFLAAGAGRDREAAGRDRGARGGLPGARAPGRAGADRAGRRGERPHPPPAAARRARRRRRLARPRPARPRGLARPGDPHGALLRDALAARHAPGRRARPAPARRRDRGETFYTAFPEGADKEQLSSSLVVVRLRRGQLDLPSDSAGFDADGIVAYSKICTHAGCAISLYRAPLFEPTDPKPALVCPCHYSTFDPSTGGTVTFGPAGRKLPNAAAEVDPKGHLRARGNFDGPVGPSWWGVRLKEADDVIRAARPVRSTSARAPRRSCARRCATCFPTTGRSCSARSRSTRSWCSSARGST